MFDYLNDILEQCLPSEGQEGSEGIRAVFVNSKFKLTETFIQNQPLDRTFVLAFFVEVKNAINEILPTMLKDINEIWRFFIYFIRMFSFFNENSDEFSSLIDLLKKFAIGAHSNENKRLSKVFMESLIESLIQEVKNAGSWFKKERLMDLIYDFSGR